MVLQLSSVSLTLALSVGLGLGLQSSADGSVSFAPPSSTGHSSAPRVDPELLTFKAQDATKSHLLCTGAVDNKTTLVESSDGGTTWQQASEEIVSAGTSGFLGGAYCWENFGRSVG